MSSDPSVRGISSKSLVDEVTNEIARAIRSGSLRPGQEFSLREIAGQLGVSFIPVREALRHLEGQGLVVMRRNRSAMVAPLDVDDLKGIYRLRRRIEPDLVAASCRLLGDADYTKLESVLDVFGDEKVGIDDVYDAHHDFHRELLRPAATAWDLRTLETLWRAAERYVRVAFAGRDREHKRRVAAHAVLLDACRSREGRVVRRLVDHHLAENERFALEAISGR